MPKPKMPDGLYISVSQLKCWLRCPRQFEVKYVRGVAPAFVPVALAFGSAFHEALAGFYSELKMTGQPLRRDLLLDAFRESWERQVTGPVPIQPDADEEPNLDQLTDKGISMLHLFHESAAKCAGDIVVEHVEHSFNVAIHDPATGEILDETLVGTMDLIVVENGRRVVVEHKSSSKKYTQDQLRYDLQATAYRLAARQAGMGDVGVRFQVVTKARQPALQVADVQRDLQDEDDFLRTASGVLRAIDAGVSYPIRGWACRTCPYSHACISGSEIVSCAA
jgi:putative RecB family exonuclease